MVNCVRCDRNVDDIYAAGDRAVMSSDGDDELVVCSRCDPDVVAILQFMVDQCPICSGEHGNRAQRRAAHRHARRMPGPS